MDSILNRSLNTLAQKWLLIEDELAQVEVRLRQVFHAAGPEINSVGAYIFNGRGKRVRPALFLTAAHRSAVKLEPLLDAAVALELLHTASLLHDDVIDQASVRRNRDAVHVKWSNKIAVLSGDYLLSSALKIIVNYQDWRLLEIVVDIVENMATGELEQAFADTSSSGLEEAYFRWIGKKSAAFFAGCCRAGSLLGGEGQDDQEAWSQFGYNLGIAFQLIDDLLDYTGKREVTGKPQYSDLSNRVITLPLIRTISSLQPGDQSIISFLNNEAMSGEQISRLAGIVSQGEGFAYTRKAAEDHLLLAAQAINKITEVSTEKRELLESAMQDLLLRKH
jgi:geranylgeranyl pyrophosphate synthase